MRVRGLEIRIVDRHRDRSNAREVKGPAWLYWMEREWLCNRRRTECIRKRVVDSRAIRERLNRKRRRRQELQGRLGNYGVVIQPVACSQAQTSIAHQVPGKSRSEEHTS